MALFQWRDDYSVKIPSIDVQHKKLVDMLNQLNDGMASGNGSAQLAPLLEGLVDYTAKHFAYEEKLFKQHGFPGSERHIAEHRNLVEQVIDFKRRYEAGQATINMQLLKFLKDWLVMHILGSDKEYSNHLVERGVK